MRDTALPFAQSQVDDAVSDFATGTLDNNVVHLFLVCNSTTGTTVSDMVFTQNTNYITGICTNKIITPSLLEPVYNCSLVLILMKCTKHSSLTNLDIPLIISHSLGYQCAKM